MLLLLVVLYGIPIAGIVLIIKSGAMFEWMHRRITVPLMKRISDKYPKLARCMNIAGTVLLVLFALAFLTGLIAYAVVDFQQAVWTVLIIHVIFSYRDTKRLSKEKKGENQSRIPIIPWRWLIIGIPLCCPIALWAFFSIEVALKALMGFEVMWWILHDWGWAQEEHNKIALFSLWEFKWLRERGHIFIGMIIWWGLGEPVAAFVALLGGSLIIGLWDIQMDAESSDKMPQKSAEFGQQVSEAALEDLVVDYTNREVMSLNDKDISTNS